MTTYASNYNIAHLRDVVRRKGVIGQQKVCIVQAPGVVEDQLLDVVRESRDRLTIEIPIGELLHGLTRLMEMSAISAISPALPSLCQSQVDTAESVSHRGYLQVENLPADAV